MAVLTYNVIGTVDGWQANIVGASYRTLKTVFAQVYLFPAHSSYNVVSVATQAEIEASPLALRQRAERLIQSRRLTLPRFRERLEVLLGRAGIPIAFYGYRNVGGTAPPPGAPHGVVTW